MRIPSNNYDPYTSNVGRAVYSQVTSGVYDSLSSSANYNTLANQHTILQQPYPNLITTSNQEATYYTNVPPEYYPMRIRSLQPVYALNETTDEIMER